MRKLKAKLNRAINELTTLATIVAIFCLLTIASYIPVYAYKFLGILAILGLCIWIHRKYTNRAEKHINEDGYVVLNQENDLEHRHIAKKILNRNLKPNEIVHHINGRKTDNHLRNLCVMDRDKHEQLHAWLSWKKKKSGEYPSFREQNRILVQEYGGILLKQILSTKLTELSNNQNNETGGITQYVDLYDCNMLFEELRKERMRIAREEKVPAYIIFYDRTLRKIAGVLPDTDLQMLKMIGPSKYQKYGPQFVTVVKKFKSEQSPIKMKKI